MISRYLFFIHYMVDKDKGVFYSLSKSWELTTDKGFKLFLFLILVFLVVFTPVFLSYNVGTMLFIILLRAVFAFITFPLAVMATIYLYREFNQED
ncbi:hypothetical protein PRVXH_000344 [Proteinivorax hydrogeniformans]|uniref:Uncharacterized protein n=1 Tax=Proteinivorax hydrogeniformans TaxID=1826727 RepID=A0AAU8HUG0_9FIRM